MLSLIEIAKARVSKKESVQSEEKGELYMSSKQWLARHGLKAKKMGFYDFLQTLAFKHCDGVVDIQHAPKGDIGYAVRRFSMTKRFINELLSGKSRSL